MNLNGLTTRHYQEFDYFIQNIEKLATLNSFQLIVFGSTAKNLQRRFSDVDIAIISDFFSGIPWIERIDYLNELTSKLGIINPVGLTSTEFETFSYPSIIRIIRKQGIKIEQ